MTIRRGIGVAAAVLAAICFTATTLAAQPHEMPKPGPETKKLDAFAGKWKAESTMQPGPWGPGGKMTSEQECTWFEGGFALVCRETASGAMGKMKSEFVLGWSGEEQVYKFMGFDSMGYMGTATGTASGNTWNWTGEDKMGGKVIKSKYTITMPTMTKQTFKWETSDDGGKTWKTAAEGSSTKR